MIVRGGEETAIRNTKYNKKAIYFRIAVSSPPYFQKRLVIPNESGFGMTWQSGGYGVLKIAKTYA
jgi:hypothetical protein